MAGIFGCFRFNGKGDVLHIADILQHNSHSDPSEALISGSFSLENIHLGFEKPVRGSERVLLLQNIDRRFSLLLFGELFLPSGEILSAKNMETEFLLPYERLGKNLFLQCDGAFVLALYDQQENSLLLATDPFGNIAIHYAKHQGMFLFSTRQSAIAEAIGQRGISESALVEMIAIGQRLEGRTLYESIYRIPSASCSSVNSSGEMKIDKYYVPDYSPNSFNAKEIFPKIEEAILRSVDIRIKQNGVLCGLTGGLDSRLTLAAIKKLGKTDTITTFTHGLPQSGDMKIAKRLSSIYDIPHLELPFDDDFLAKLPKYWREVTMLSEGGLGLENALNLLTWGWQAQEFSVLLDSQGGPIYRRQIFKSKEGMLIRSNNFPQSFFKLFSQPLLDSGFLRKDIEENAKRIGKDVIKEYFSTLPEGLAVGDKIDRFYLEQMCANKYSLESNTQLQYIGLSHPLLSLQAYDLATKLPSAKRKTNAIYKYLFNRLAPELKNIMVDNSGFAIPYYGYRSLRYVPQVFEKILSSLPIKNKRLSLRKPSITAEILLQKNLGALKDLLLDNEHFARKYFISENVEKALIEFERTGRYAPQLLQTANVYLLLEVFGGHS